VNITQRLWRFTVDGGQPELMLADMKPVGLADGDVVYGWNRGDAAWTRVADLAPLGLHGVTRMAVPPSGERIASVTQ
jgi:hypothetical protein